MAIPRRDGATSFMRWPLRTNSPSLMGFTNPIYRKMVEIAKSSQGKAAMEEAAANGQPAICGLDRLLQNRLGKDYSDSTTPGTIMSAAHQARMISSIHSFRL